MQWLLNTKRTLPAIGLSVRITSTQKYFYTHTHNHSSRRNESVISTSRMDSFAYLLLVALWHCTIYRSQTFAWACRRRKVHQPGRVHFLLQFWMLFKLLNPIWNVWEIIKKKRKELNAKKLVTMQVSTVTHWYCYWDWGQDDNVNWAILGWFGN